MSVSGFTLNLVFGLQVEAYDIELDLDATTAAPTDSEEDGFGFPWWVILLIVLTILSSVVALVLAVILCGRR